MRAGAHDIEPEDFVLHPLPEEVKVVMSIEFKSVHFRRLVRGSFQVPNRPYRL